MTMTKRSKLSLVSPLQGKLTIVQINKKPIHTKYAMIDILELEKAQFTFESPLNLPTDHEVIYGFGFMVSNRMFHSVGHIELVNEKKDSYVYKAAIQPNDYEESEILYEINQLATLQNKEFVKLTKSYDPDRIFDDVVVDYMC
ncbi:hypothetical protein [Paenibacillus aceris]|uniref:Uncharacterized protein n=1 Tax=Paenibacillus aceris TaxID=869555 RepID=A0ABS4I824_9BACL|nr:hypothetical protein [Paenibacillus aceris]MBP1967081.1 hypothetical protein [Paenibacillus aceris]NHW33275.1 hypothetical protein [Paenibacillus aceris]